LSSLQNKYDIQQSKVTEKIGEFQKFIDNDSDTIMCLKYTLKFFEIQHIFDQFDSSKQKEEKNECFSQIKLKNH